MEKNKFDDDIWKRVNAKVREQYADSFIGIWFDTVEVLDMDEDRVVLYVPNDIVRKMIKDRYGEGIAAAIEEIMGYRIPIEFTGDRGTTASQLTAAEKKRLADEADRDNLPGHVPGSKTVEFTFDNFVQGASNKLAYAACFAVASNVGIAGYDHIGDMYNPLFLYGQSGLGKTHLMYSIKNHVNAHFPAVTLIYITGEDFTNQLIEAIQFKKTREFRDKFRQADILIIDDIQFIQNKPSVQEEIFHTFNYLYEQNKQIVFTSDKPPKDINPLEERLRTRFEQSMIADIQPPDIELRMAIIKQKAEKLHISLSNEVVTYMADRLKSNIRQVEGAIKKLAALSFLDGKQIQIETARLAIADLLTEEEPQNVIADRILETCAKRYGVSVADMKDKGQSAKIVNARNIAIYLLRSLTENSLNAIGAIIGKNHATVMHSLKNVEMRINAEPLFGDEIQELINEIRG